MKISRSRSRDLKRRYTTKSTQSVRDPYFYGFTLACVAALVLTFDTTNALADPRNYEDPFFQLLLLLFLVAWSCLHVYTMFIIFLTDELAFRSRVVRAVFACVTVAIQNPWTRTFLLGAGRAHLVIRFIMSAAKFVIVMANVATIGTASLHVMNTAERVQNFSGTTEEFRGVLRKIRNNAMYVPTPAELKRMDKENDNMCIICHDDVKRNPKYTDACDHGPFHARCLVESIVVNPGCPMCRKDIKY